MMLRLFAGAGRLLAVCLRLICFSLVCLTVTAGLIVGVMVWHTASAKPHERWFLMNLHGEACVPLDHISIETQLLDDATGPMHNPTEMVNLMREVGMQVSLWPSNAEHPGLFMFAMSPRDIVRDPVLITLINDETKCRRLVALQAAENS